MFKRNHKNSSTTPHQRRTAKITKLLLTKPLLLSEQQLIHDCQNGKKTSQYELVKRYSAMLMTVCRRYASDEPMAKDMLQESLIRIFKYIKNYKHTGSFEAWMRKITANCALRWLQKKHLRHETATDEFSHQEKLNPKVLEQYDMEVIILQIQQLPAGFRAVFNLNVIDGYNHREIAELLGITESTSRSQLARAKRLLQQKLTQMDKIYKRA